MLQQLRFLTELLEKLQDADKSSQIIQDLLLLRAELTNPANIILHISADLQNLVSKFKNPSDCISKIIPENEIPNRTRLFSHIFRIVYSYLVPIDKLILYIFSQIFFASRS